LELLFAEVVEPKDVAAIIVEPVLGEGGYVVPPPEFLPQLRAITTRHGILLIADEIQTGFGRTGRFFAVEHSGTVPDIVVIAKGIASGLPLSGILADRQLLAQWPPGAHGGTYGGNVVACAAANATLDVIQSEHLIENAEARGVQLLAGLRTLKAAHPSIGDARGLGLMGALEFVDPSSSDGRAPDPGFAHRVIAGSLNARLIVLSAGRWGQVVRLIPPLITTEAEVDTAIEILDSAVSAAEAA
jgi:4-aminobutyrate aminotransferase